MRVAAARYAIGMPPDFDAFAAHQRRLLGDAAAQGAQIAVLPEYLALELAATFDDSVRSDTRASLAAVQRYRDDWLTLFAGLARHRPAHRGRLLPRRHRRRPVSQPQ